MLVNREIILAAIESAYITDAEPAATDAILVEDLQWSLAGLRMNERPAIRGNIGKLQQIFGGHLVNVSFSAEIKGSGTAGTAPEIGTLLRACGMGETVVATTSVAYSPVSEDHESISIYFYRDGKLFKIVGNRGNVSMALEAGATGKMQFSFTGHLLSETDAAMITPTYDSTVPVAVIGAGFSIGSYSAVISALNSDLGNTLATPPDINAGNGYAEVRITSRDVICSFDPEETLLAANDWLGDLQAGTTMALDTGTIGSTAGNIYQVTKPAVYYRELAPGDRDGLRTLDVSCGCAESSGDDEMTITFT